jgi:hypothetical protein
MRAWLAVSVALNLYFLTSMVAARIDPERSDLRAGQGGVEAGVFESGRAGWDTATDDQGLLAVLAGTPLGEAEVKSLVLGWLEAKYRGSFEHRVVGFWEPGYLPGAESVVAELESEQRVREALLRMFGAAAGEDPAFDAVFRPLGPAYGFLGSAAQLSLRRQQLEELERRLALGRAGSPGASVPGAGDVSNRTGPCRRAAPQPADFPASLEVSDLSEHERSEYRLRFSALATQLREAGVAGSEAEFRDWYALVQQLESGTDPSGRASVRAELRARMGDDAFARFWSLRDPLFAPVDEYLTREGFARHDVLAAYTVINRAQEALLTAIGRGGADTSTIAAVQKVEQDQAQRLSRLLGPEAAEGLEAAISHFAVRLSQGSVAAC